MADAAPRLPTVFLSYASENREAARRIGATLPAFGLEVWYDESELGGGDAWDQKIRRQIRECDYFMAVVSAQTEARREGYFRREWRLAAERTLDMADDHLFLLPVVIDDTDATHARVPEKFNSVQWLRLPDGQSTPALETLCRRLASGDTTAPPPRASLHPGGAAPGPSQPSQPSQPSEPSQPAREGNPFHATPFPHREDGQGMRFGVEVLGWTARNGWTLWRRLPGWIRWSLIIWATVALLSQNHSRGGGSSSSRHAEPTVSPSTQKKLDAIAQQVTQGGSATNWAQLGTLVAKEFGDAAKGKGATVLAIPFTAAADDAAGARLAEAAFAQTYTRIAVARHGQLSIDELPVTDCNPKALLALGGTRDSDYVLCGVAAGGASAVDMLAVTLVDVDAGRVQWRGEYPVAAADPAAIARDVADHVPATARDD